MITRFLCTKPYWLWWLLFHVSPWHHGYDAGYEQAVKNLRAVDR